jgi:glycosyltransferase involved in cell wall biosynthesis
MKLSVLVTFYNQGKFVDCALSSIFSQKIDFPFEVLIGDDGSSDDTIHKIQKWLDRYPTKIKLFVNARDINKEYEPIFRASANRINLIKHANGEYCAFLDGDDFYIDDNKFQIQIDILDNKNNKDCIACAHNTNLYWENGKTVPMNDVYMNEQKVKPIIYWSKMYFCSISFVFRNIFKGTFPTFFKNMYFDDNLIIIYLLKFGNIYYYPQIMVNYRQSSNSSWNARSLDEQHILNAIDYDIEKQIAPEFEAASLIRHFPNFKYLYENRCRLDSKVKQKILTQAQNVRAFEALKWITYTEQSFFQKIKLNLFYNIMKRRYKKMVQEKIREEIWDCAT